jgi:hypothetical protein
LTVRSQWNLLGISQHVALNKQEPHPLAKGIYYSRSLSGVWIIYIEILPEKSEALCRIITG